MKHKAEENMKLFGTIYAVYLCTVNSTKEEAFPAKQFSNARQKTRHKSKTYNWTFSCGAFFFSWYAEYYGHYAFSSVILDLKFILPWIIGTFSVCNGKLFNERKSCLVDVSSHTTCPRDDITFSTPIFSKYFSIFFIHLLRAFSNLPDFLLYWISHTRSYVL